MFQISNFKYVGRGKYGGDINFSKGLKGMDSDEFKKMNDTHERLAMTYIQTYNPIRLNENYLYMTLSNCVEGFKPEMNAYYDVSIKIQKYVYNDKVKLRAIISSIKLSSKSIIYEDA
jgi:hypothetical protein